MSAMIANYSSTLEHAIGLGQSLMGQPATPEEEEIKFWLLHLKYSTFNSDNQERDSWGTMRYAFAKTEQEAIKIALKNIIDDIEKHTDREYIKDSITLTMHIEFDLDEIDTLIREARGLEVIKKANKKIDDGEGTIKKNFQNNLKKF